MRYIFLAALLVVSVIHLSHRWKADATKDMTKPFLLPLILAYYITATPQISVPLVIALVTSWLGDVLLMPSGNKWFIFGGIGFLISHISFVVTYALGLDFSLVKWWIVVPVALLYFVVSGCIIKSLISNTPKMMLVPMFAYLLTNSTMNCFALMQLIAKPCFGSAIAYAGAVLFFVSDCTLFLVRYHKNPELIPRRHFVVMLTYITGELLITQGMIMLTA